MFLGFNLHAWITIATVLTLFSVLLFTKLRSDLVFLGAIAILFVTGVLDAKEAFSGFSSCHSCQKKWGQIVTKLHCEK